MKQLIITVTYCFLIITGEAQVTHRDLLNKFSMKDVSASIQSKDSWKPYPKTPAEWKIQLDDSIIQKYIRFGDDALKFEFKNIPASVALEYARTGDRDNYQKLSFDKRGKLFDLVIAESMEGKSRFMEQIMNGLWSIFEETFWGVPAHLGTQKAGTGLPDAEDIIVDLFSAETAAAVSVADYLVGEKLDKISPLLRKRIYFEVNRRILTPLEIDSKRYGYLGSGKRDVAVNNWNPWIISNWMLANLLLEKNPDRRTKAVMHQMELLDLYVNGLGDDGATDEGPSYWFAAGASMFDALDLLQNVTNNKVNIYNQPIIQKMGSYIYKTHIQGQYFINVADASPVMKPNGLLLYRFGKAINDTIMMQFGSWAIHQNVSAVYQPQTFQRMRTLGDLSISKEAFNYAAKAPAINDVWFPNIQLMSARTDDGLYIASHGGHNAESHNHNDVGDFILYADGYPVIIDIGSGTYTSKTFSKDRYNIWYNTSAYHNLPTINGQQQSAGRKAEAMDVKYSTGTSAVTFSTNLTKAYPEEAALNAITRSINVNKTKGYIDVTDTYDMKKSSELMQSFMTTCTVDLNIPGKIIFIKPDGNKVSLLYNKNQWSATKEKVELTAPEDKKIYSTWEGKDIYRVVLKSTGTSMKTKTLYHFSK